ncbi:MAG: hypothetical protein IPK85_02025 [Gemmatimonadetes bacterium]|nr:hypothetical protein [Gemmatimonadota bacterium]
MSDEHHMIACGQHAEARRVAEARIAALEATVARLTAVISPSDLRAFETAWAADAASGGDGTLAALTVFLERRMKG